jgi:hypothetical protein
MPKQTNLICALLLLLSYGFKRNALILIEYVRTLLSQTQMKTSKVLLSFVSLFEEQRWCRNKIPHAMENYWERC